MQNLKNLIKKDSYNFLSPYGLGDTLMLCGYKAAWEKIHKGKIHFIIKPSHEVIMKMYGITDYSLFNFSINECKSLKHSLLPKIGKLYIAHPNFLKNSDYYKEFLNLKITFKTLYARMLGVEEKLFKSNFNFPKLSYEVRKKLKKLSPLDKIVLFCPEANSIKLFPKKFWEFLAYKLRKEGYCVIANITNENNSIYGAESVSLSLEEIMGISRECHAVYSIRSGLCDLIAQDARNLKIYYDSEKTLALYSLSSIFQKSNIQESVITNLSNNMRITPLVTIVTVVKNLLQDNRKEKIIRCIKSVHNQSYKNIEHVIIDGGSNDGTIPILKKFEKKNWIKLISENDNGIYDAMNKGIDYASGKYIAFLNSDDFYHNQNAIKTTIDMLENKEADFSYGIAKCVDESAGISLLFKPNEMMVMSQMPFSHQTLFCKTNLLRMNKFDTNFKLAADYDFILCLLQKKYFGINTHMEIVTYSLNGRSSQQHSLCIQEYKKVYKKHFPYLNEKSMDKMILKGIVPRRVKNFYLKNYVNFFNIKSFLIIILGIPFYKHLKIDNNIYGKLFSILPILKIKKFRNSIYFYLFCVKIIKIDIRKWRLQ